MKIALIQQSCVEDKTANINKLESNIRSAALSGADLIVLQELHNTLYFCQTEDTANFSLAEPIPGPSTDFFSSLAAELHVVLVISLFEKAMEGLCFNTAVVIDSDGSLRGKYRKMHIPDDPGFYEKFYFTPGDLGFHPVETSVGRLGVMVCWDQWYPEAARLMALAGADMLIYPTAIGYDPNDTPDEQNRQREAWMTVQRGHSVANGIFTVAVNRVGHEPDPSGVTSGIDFWGSSFVSGPQGEIIAQASQTDEQNLIVEVDLSRMSKVRPIWPYFRDRRIDAYPDILKRHR